jgi:hypothetical protein
MRKNSLVMIGVDLHTADQLLPRHCPVAVRKVGSAVWTERTVTAVQTASCLLRWLTSLCDIKPTAARLYCQRHFINTPSLRHVSTTKGSSSGNKTDTMQQPERQNEWPDVKFSLASRVYWPILGGRNMTATSEWDHNFRHTCTICKDFVLLCAWRCKVCYNCTCTCVLTSTILHVTHFGDLAVALYQFPSLKTVAYRGRCLGGSNPPTRNSEVLTKLSRIPSSVENTSVTV